MASLHGILVVSPGDAALEHFALMIDGAPEIDHLAVNLHMHRIEASSPMAKPPQGKRFEQRYVLLFAILAIVTGADSYRGIHTFIRVHLKRLDRAFGLGWKKPPAHTSIRSILSGLDGAHVEAAFRSHAADLGAARPPGQDQCRVVAIDGKVLRGSFDAFHDGSARQFLSAFAAETALTIAHIEIDEKSNEIPAAQQLLTELDLTGRIVTLDAIHCQKNICDRQGKGRGPDRPAQGEPESPAQAG